ncbi:MAG: hypothetical protein JSS34_00770 [Proteobacteria bacterium]|nr:hypothetical protein [Pseudomonadota bacterium]
MTYIKHSLFIFIGIWMCSLLFFVKEGQCLEEDSADATRPGTALRRKTNSTIRSRNRDEFLEKLKAVNAQIEVRRQKEVPTIQALWSSAFEASTDFQKIVNHLIADDLKSEKSAFRLDVTPGEHPLFELLYQNKEDKASQSKVLVSIEFISNFSEFSKKEKGEQKKAFVKQKNPYNFSRILRRPLRNLNDYSTIKLFLNALDGIILNHQHVLSWYGIPEEKKTRTVLIKSDNNRAVKVTYFKDVLTQNDFVAPEVMGLKNLSLKSEYPAHKEDMRVAEDEEESEYMSTAGAAQDGDSSSSEGEYLYVGDGAGGFEYP